MSKNVSGYVDRIDTGSFDSSISALTAAIDALSNAKRVFESSSEQMLSCWEGYGSDAFENAYKKLKTNLNDEEDNLGSIKEDLVSIKESYAKWDNDSASGLSSNDGSSSSSSTYGSSGGGGGGGRAW